jgi:hypothetical protein
MRIRCRGNPFTGQLPSDSPDIVDVLTGHYQATHVLSRVRCIATAIHATVLITYSGFYRFYRRKVRSGDTVHSFDNPRGKHIERHRKAEQTMTLLREDEGEAA